MLAKKFVWNKLRTVCNRNIKRYALFAYVFIAVFCGHGEEWFHLGWLTHLPHPFQVAKQSVG